MKKIHLIIILILFSFLAFSQRKKLPPDGVMYGYYPNDCSFPRQTGNLNIVKTDTGIALKTDSLEIKIPNSLVGRMTVWKEKKHYPKTINLTVDSLAKLLFLNGLLTPELLCKASTHDQIVIDSKGDTTYIPGDPLLLKNFELIDIQIEHKRGIAKYNYLCFLIFTDYKKEENNEPIIKNHGCLYSLLLKSNINAKKCNLERFVKNAHIHRFVYEGLSR